MRAVRICNCYRPNKLTLPIDDSFRIFSSDESDEIARRLTGAGRDHVDTTARLKLDPDGFLAQEERREKALRMQDAVRPGRTTSIALRLDRFTLRRLKALATLRGVRYQTLLKQFVVERLYEEEKRAGIIDR